LGFIRLFNLETGTVETFEAPRRSSTNVGILKASSAIKPTSHQGGNVLLNKHEAPVHVLPKPSELLLVPVRAAIHTSLALCVAYAPHIAAMKMGKPDLARSIAYFA